MCSELQKTNNIISVSRRTDIPCFYSDWFLSTLKQSFVLVENPFSHQKQKFSLHPDDVLGFVFWSRYPIGLTKILDFIDGNYGKNHYINYTINDYPRELEPNKPRLQRVLNLVDFLYDRYGEKYILWRFDPIIVTNITPIEYVIEKFYKLCKILSGKTNFCITSFVDLYSKVVRRIKQQGKFQIVDLDFNSRVELLQTFQKIALEHKIEIRLCCENDLSKFLCIEPASCVDPSRFPEYRDSYLMRAPTRKGCTCWKSVDLGFYNSCLFDCTYCYSNISRKSSLKNYLKRIESKI